MIQISITQLIKTKELIQHFLNLNRIRAVIITCKEQIMKSKLNKAMA